MTKVICLVITFLRSKESTSVNNNIHVSLYIIYYTLVCDIHYIIMKVCTLEKFYEKENKKV
jgi:hypothetical protein